MIMLSWHINGNGVEKDISCLRKTSPLRSPSSNCLHHRPAQDRPRQHGQQLLWGSHNTDNVHVHVVDGDKLEYSVNNRTRSAIDCAADRHL